MICIDLQTSLYTYTFPIAFGGQHYLQFSQLRSSIDYHSLKDSIDIDRLPVVLYITKIS